MADPKPYRASAAAGSISTSICDPALLKIANKIAVHFATMTNWGTWHLWEYFERCRPQTVGEAAENIWRETQPNGTCVDQSFAVAPRLRHVLNSTPGLEQYADKVKTMSCPMNATAPLPLYRCIVAICTENFCVVLDVGIHPAALVVPLGGTAQTCFWIPLSGKKYEYWRFSYHIDTTTQSKSPVLTLEQPTLSGISTMPLPFSDITHEYAVEHLDCRIARCTAMYKGYRVPADQWVTINTAMSEQPVRIPYVKVDGADAYIVTSCRLSASFSKRSIMMQVPLEDYFLHLSNPRSAFHRVQNMLKAKPTAKTPKEASEMATWPLDVVVVNLMLDLNRPRWDPQVQEDVWNMAELGELLALPHAQFLRYVESVYEHCEHVDELVEAAAADAHPVLGWFLQRWNGGNVGIHE